tara:strand:- start:133 stop:426 length:294 start_codon:yes stop_codon:yes gene_type:complete
MKTIKTAIKKELRFKITQFGRIYTDKFGRVWQLVKSGKYWNLHCFDNMDDFNNALCIKYETWCDGGYTIQTAKDFIKGNIQTCEKMPQYIFENKEVA